MELSERGGGIKQKKIKRTNESFPPGTNCLFNISEKKEVGCYSFGELKDKVYG